MAPAFCSSVTELNVNTITQHSDDEESSAKSGQGQNTTSTLITHPLTKNSQIINLTQNRRDSSNSKQGDIEVPVPEKQAAAAAAGDGLHDRGTVREVNDLLYVQIRDIPEASGDEDDDYQSAAVLCARDEAINENAFISRLLHFTRICIYKYCCTPIVISFALAHIHKVITLSCIHISSLENPTHCHLFRNCYDLIQHHLHLLRFACLNKKAAFVCICIYWVGTEGDSDTHHSKTEDGNSQNISPSDWC